MLYACWVFSSLKGNEFIFSGENSVKLFPRKGFASQGSTPERKDFVVLGVKSFLLEMAPFQKRISVQETRQNVTEVVSLLIHVEKPLSISEKKLYAKSNCQVRLLH